MSPAKLKQKTINRTFLKLIALFFSVSMWLYVLNSEPLEVEKMVSIKFITPVDKAIGNIIPSVVKLRLRGPRAFLRGLFIKQSEQLIFDLSDMKDRDYIEYNLDPSLISVPFGVEVLEVIPSKIGLELQKEIKKYVPVKVVWAGEIGQDLQLLGHKVSPSKVMIRGPIEVLRGIGVAKTSPINLSQLIATSDIRTSLADLDERVSVETEDDIEVNVNVRPKKANLTLQRVPIRILSTHSRYTASVKFADLSILASEELKLTTDDVRILAEIPANAKGNISLKLNVDLPEGAHLLKIQPETIKVRVR